MPHLQHAELARTDPLRVLVADGSWHYAQALAAALTRQIDIEVSGVVYASDDAMRHVIEHAPAVALLSLDLPPAGGVKICEEIRLARPEIAIVVVTALRDEEPARQALAAGAHAYMIKHDHHDPERIGEAIRSAARGDHLLDRDIHGLLQSLASQAPDPARQAGLSPREREILPLIAEGLQNKEIAARVGLSEQTVRNHLSSIYRKLRTKNRTETIADARRRRILP